MPRARAAIRRSDAAPMLVLISAAPSLFARAPFTARRVFVGSGPATGRSKVLAGLQPRSRPVAMADSFVDDEVEMMGQKVDWLGHTLRARCRHTARTRNAHGTRTAHTLHTAHTHTRHTHGALGGGAPFRRGGRGHDVSQEGMPHRTRTPD